MKLFKCKYIYYVFYFVAAGYFIGITGCSKMDATYKDIVKGGAIIYPGKADSIIARSGNGRIALSWIINDPNVKKCVIHWNQGQDSLIIPIDKVKDIDTIHTMIEGLNEGIYEFTIYSFDKEGNKSVESSVLGRVYGQKFNNSIVNRFINNISVDNGTVIIAWTNPDDGAIGEEVTYTTRSGTLRTIFVPLADDARLENYKASKPFIYRTAYLPDSTAIDTFYTEEKTGTVDRKAFETELDRSQFSLFSLPGDYSTANGGGNTVDKIWMNSEGAQDGGTYISKVNGHVFPQWFTIDLGGSYNLTRMKLYQRGSASASSRFFDGGNLKEFEVWGSANPDPNYNPDDHGGDFGSSWVLLKSVEVTRPSGNPIGASNTPQDIAAGLAGQEVFFNDVGAVKYIRIKAISNWDSKHRDYVNISSIVLWSE